MNGGERLYSCEMAVGYRVYFYTPFHWYCAEYMAIEYFQIRNFYRVYIFWREGVFNSWCAGSEDIKLA